MKIAYLFTRFPVESETFLQREVRAMRALGVDVEIYALWRGQEQWQGIPVTRISDWQLPSLLWRLPRRLLRNPRQLREVFDTLWASTVTSPLNVAETWRGLAAGLILADLFDKRAQQTKRAKGQNTAAQTAPLAKTSAAPYSEPAPDLCHCVWATMPATAGYLIEKLTGIPFSMGAHAYDIFKDGGDCLLPQKLKAARFVHTTTEQARKRLIELGGAAESIVLIRRGMDELPPCRPPRPASERREKLRLLCVGRLVEKKGYTELLRLCHHWRLAGLAFELRIVGGGPLHAKLAQEINHLQLGDCVQLCGAKPFEQVREEYARADALLFSGKIASDGDRDGLPNVIAEAMALGLPVITSPVAGTTEAVSHGESGFVAPLDAPEQWLPYLCAIRDDSALYERLRTNARTWVEAHYDNRLNSATLANCFTTALNANSNTKQHERA